MEYKNNFQECCMSTHRVNLTARVTGEDNETGSISLRIVIH